MRPVGNVDTTGLPPPLRAPLSPPPRPARQMKSMSKRIEQTILQSVCHLHSAKCSLSRLLCTALPLYLSLCLRSHCIYRCVVRCDHICFFFMYIIQFAHAIFALYIETLYGACLGLCLCLCLCLLTRCSAQWLAISIYINYIVYIAYIYSCLGKSLVLKLDQSIGLIKFLRIYLPY